MEASSLKMERVNCADAPRCRENATLLRHLGAAAGVFLIAVGWFSIGIADVGIASAYCDPVSRIESQDEAVYLREAIEMATGGTWGTPTYLGRYALNKPPLTQWLSALSLKIFGISAWAGRLPLVIAASLTVALVFAWVARVNSIAAAAVAAVLLMSSHLFYVFSRLVVTDMLLTLWIVAALFVLARDPAMERRWSAVLFGAFTGAGVLTKGAAGLLPFFAFAFYLVITASAGSRLGKHRLKRVTIAVAAAAAVALPWHLYQFVGHPRWFFAEYVLTQHLSVGVTAPPQYSNENHLVFYARRLFLMDPVLTVASAIGLIVLLRQWRRHSVTLGALIALVLAMFAFRYRSAYYVLPLLPVLAVIAAQAVAAMPVRARAAALGLAALFGGVKLVSASPTWSIPAGRAAELAAAPALRQYCALGRANDLILIAPDDQFYSSDLPLRRVRYCLIGEPSASGSMRRPLDFEWLGIALSVAEFNKLAALRPAFRERLATFDLPSDEALGTVIWARSTEEVAQLIAGNPTADFLVARSFLQRLKLDSAHRIVPAHGERVLLLSGQYAGVHRPAWSCEL